MNKKKKKVKKKIARDYYFFSVSFFRGEMEGSQEVWCSTEKGKPLYKVIEDLKKQGKYNKNGCCVVFCMRVKKTDCPKSIL